MRSVGLGRHRRPGEGRISGPRVLGADAGTGREPVHDNARRCGSIPSSSACRPEVLDRRLHVGLGLLGSTGGGVLSLKMK